MAAGWADSPPQAPPPTNAAQAELFAEMGIGHQDKVRRFCVLLTFTGKPPWKSFDAIHGAEQQVLLAIRQDFQIGPKLGEAGVVQIMASRTLAQYVAVFIRLRQFRN
jgi:hypothetical protein